MNTFDEILEAYVRQVQLPWADDTPPAGRVWMVWYDKTLQRRFTGRLGEFEHATLKAGHGWRQMNLSPWFGQWVAKHEFFDALVSRPRELRGLMPEIEDELVRTVRRELAECPPNDVLAFDGCGSVFGIARVSTLISRTVDAIAGRLLVGFSGKHAGGVYRLLDARDGWNYHALPIPPENPL